MSCEAEEAGRAAQQLAAEAAWCLADLERQLAAGKLGERKAKEVRKARRLLKAEETQLVQRRQLMRTHCGDYRAKMRAEEEAVKLDAGKVKFNKVDLKASSNFMKKASEKKCENAEGRTEFRFDFKLPDETAAS